MERWIDWGTVRESMWQSETHSKLMLELQLKLDNSLSIFDDNLFLFLLLPIYLFNIFETWLLCVDQLSWNLLYRLDWLWTQRSFCFYLWSAGITIVSAEPFKRRKYFYQRIHILHKSQSIHWDHKYYCGFPLLLVPSPRTEIYLLGDAKRQRKFPFDTVSKKGALSYHLKSWADAVPSEYFGELSMYHAYIVRYSSSTLPCES